MKKFFRRILPGEKEITIFKEEKVQSPFKSKMKLFFTRKLTIVGLIIFFTILMSSMFAPFWAPLEREWVDSTQHNIRPGFFFMSYPRALPGNVLDISAGNNFAVGVDNAGEFHIWGNIEGLINQHLDHVPENMGYVLQVSAGFNHVLVLNDEGNVFSWGLDSFGLQEIPAGVSENRITYIHAGRQISIAIDENNQVYVWGNENVVNIRAGAIRGEDVRKIDTTTTSGLALLENGTVVSLTNRDLNINRFPDNIDDIQGRIVDMAVTRMAAAAVLDDGTVVVWGAPDFDSFGIPYHVQGNAIAIDSGQDHFTVRLNDGTVASWGFDKHGQARPPILNDIVAISVGFYQNYAIDSEGRIHTWGLRGYLLGTDGHGRCVFRRLVASGRISLTIGAVATLIANFLGILVGSISGYYSGKVDVFLMRVAEVWGAIPTLPTLIIVSGLIGNRLPEGMRVFMLMSIIGFLGWTSMARQVRAQMLEAREQEYVTAAKALGVITRKIIFSHIFPNIVALVAVRFSLSLANSLLTEASLSFLGLGIREPTPTWGSMLNASMDSTVIRDFWWRWLPPALFLGLATVSLHIMGDGMREAFDPKIAGKG